MTQTIIEEISTDPKHEEFLDRQTKLEDQMHGMGVDRHWSRIELV
jgi:hypothetical protein